MRAAHKLANALHAPRPSLYESGVGEADKFLRRVAGNSHVTFRTIDDSGAKRPPLIRSLQGWNDVTRARLGKLNASGAGVFFMFNQADGNGGKAENVLRIRGLFVDLDGQPLEPVLAAPLPPHITVESSPGRYHAYWLIDGIALNEFTNFQLQLAKRFSSDPSVSDLPRIMRLPGFLHQKTEPRPTRILHLDEGRFNRDTFVRAFDLDERRTVASVRRIEGKLTVGARNTELFSRARGFVNKGFLPAAVNQRMQAYNARHCEPPLCARDVDEIVARACAEPAKGAFGTPYWLCDAAECRKLSDIQFRIAALAFRRGENGSEFSLTWEDYKDIFPHDQRFYNARKAIESVGIIRLVRESSNTKEGRSPRIYRLTNK